MGLEQIVGETMMKERKKRGYEQVVYISDLHMPYSDKKTLAAVNKFLTAQQPEQLVIGGDLIDMYSVSQFNKDPSRASQLQEELDDARDYLIELRNMLPKTKITYIEGNHEDRLRKYLMRHPELHGLRALEIPSLLDLKELKIDYTLDYTYKGFLFKHGNRASMYSARWELNDEGTSGMSGHIHKPQSFTDKTRRGEKKWSIVGHLSDESKADYLGRGGTSSWVEGFGVVNFYPKEKLWNVDIVDIIDHKFVYEGVVYK